MKRTFETQDEILELRLELEFILQNAEVLLYQLTPENKEAFMTELEILQAINANINFKAMTSQKSLDIILAVDNTIQSIIGLYKPMFMALYQVFRKQNLQSVTNKMRNYE